MYHKWIGRFLSLGIAIVVLGMTPLAAQSTAERAALRRFQDSLRTVRDGKALSALELATINIAKQQRADPIVHLRLGLIALRLDDLDRGKHLEDAISEFEWAVEQKPEWPWPWYGLALAERVAPDKSTAMAGGLFTMLKLDRDTKAGTAFANAFKADSNFEEGLLGLADVVLDQRNGPPISSTLSSVRKMTAKQTDPLLFLALGRLERLGGSPDSALLAFSRAKNAGGFEPLIMLEIARTIPLVSGSTVRLAGLPEGDVAYYTGAASDDPDVVEMYRNDIEPIIQDSTLKEFDAAHGAARVKWLRNFWGTRDQLDLLPVGSRLEEHYRRWAYVRQNYRLPRERRIYAAGMESYKSGNAEVDDRGIVYLRHGQPTQIFNFGPGGRAGSLPSSRCGPTTALPNSLPRTANGRADPNGNQIPIQQIGPKNLMALRAANEQNYGNETWIYRRPDAEMMLHFAANHNPLDYRLQATVFGLAAGAGSDDGDLPQNPAMRQKCIFAGSDMPFDWSMLSEEKIRAKNANMMATTTDSWTRTYPEALPGRPAWFGVGSFAGQPLMHLVYSINASVLTPLPWSKVPVTMRAVFLDAAGKIVATLDTVKEIPRPAQSSGIVVMQMEVPLPVNAQRVRLNVEITPDLGVLHRVDTLHLPRVDGNTLSLSDILIGRSPTSLSWRASPTDIAWLDPRRINYAPTDTLQVYAEAYGTVPGEKYSVSLAFTRVPTGLSKLVGKRTPAISLVESYTFDNVGRVGRAVSLASLEPGNYIMEMTVQGKNGKVTQERAITITKP